MHLFDDIVFRHAAPRAIDRDLVELAAWSSYLAAKRIATWIQPSPSQPKEISA